MASVEHHGVWWEPGHLERQRVGTLRFDGREGATLTLIVPPDNTGFEPPLESYDVLHGRSTSGERISLLKCFDQSTKGSFGEQPRPIEVFANEVVVGFHCDSTDPILGTASATFRHLQPWLGRSGIEIEPPTSPRDLSLRYRSSPSLVLHDDDHCNVAITSGWTGSLSHAAVTVREGIHLEVKGKAPAKLSELRRVLSACGDLLSVLCQRYCAIDELVLLPPAVESQPRRLGTHHAVPIYGDRDRSYNPGDTLVPSTALAERLPSVFSRFITQAEKLHDVRALYLSGVYGGGFIENKLIALTQAAEAFHRRFYAGEYMSGDAFAATVLPALEAALPESLDQGHRASLRARFAYGHEFSQRKRIGELFKIHDRTLRVLARDPLAFVGPMIDHRNAFTHFPVPTETASPAAKDVDKVLRYNFLLKLLIEACLLEAAGLQPDEIATLAQASHRHAQLAARFFAE